MRGGKHSEWEGGFREPFIVRWPGKVPANKVSDRVICLTDLVAAFASSLDAPLPKGNAEDSFDVLRAFTEAKPGAPLCDHVLPQSAGAIYDLRMGDWQLVERADAPEFEPVRNKRKTGQAAAKKKKTGQQSDEFYNPKQDPAETKNVLAANAELAAKMKKFLSEARDRGFTRPNAGK